MTSTKSERDGTIREAGTVGRHASPELPCLKNAGPLSLNAATRRRLRRGAVETIAKRQSNVGQAASLPFTRKQVGRKAPANGPAETPAIWGSVESRKRGHKRNPQISQLTQFFESQSAKSSSSSDRWPACFRSPRLVDRFFATLHTLNVGSRRFPPLCRRDSSIFRSSETLNVAACCPAFVCCVPAPGRLRGGRSRRFSREQRSQFPRRTPRRGDGRAGWRQRAAAGRRPLVARMNPLAIVPGGNAGSSLEPHENSIVRRFAVYLVTDGKADVNEPGPQGPDVVWYAQSSGPATKERVGNRDPGEAPVHGCDAPGLTHVDRREVRGRSLEDTCLGGAKGGRQFRL